MYYLIQGYRLVNDCQSNGSEHRLEATPIRTQAVTINQLAGAIIRMLATGIDTVQVSSISEETFTYFYQERKRNGETRV